MPQVEQYSRCLDDLMRFALNIGRSITPRLNNTRNEDKSSDFLEEADMVPRSGIEPPTPSLPRTCSAPELPRRTDGAINPGTVPRVSGHGKGALDRAVGSRHVAVQ